MKAPGNKTGRRPTKLAVSKAEMADLVGRLHSLGLGFRVIGNLLGYSHWRISEIARDAGIDPHDTREGWREFLVAAMPDDLRSQVTRVYTRSMVAIERATNRVNEAPARTQHRLVDEDDESCVNPLAVSTRSP